MDAPVIQTTPEPLLEVQGLSICFSLGKTEFMAVDNISFTVGRGEALGIVGESGCGKSVTSLSIMGLIDSQAGRVAGGRINFESHDLLQFSAAQMRQVRGKKISMIFQEPMTSLNPVHSIGDQIVESLLEHESIDRGEARRRALAMLELVRIPSPNTRMNAYPHELSGGMRQRVMIALALACNPQLLIADEATTALDVTIQAQILELMKSLRVQTGTSIILVTHDLGIVAEYADRVLVMYAGKVVESASVTDLFSNAQHPYTIGLMSAMPRVDIEQADLAQIDGNVPGPFEQITGCRFSPRCPFADDQCRAQEPPTREIHARHLVSCWKAPVEESSIVA